MRYTAAPVWRGIASGSSGSVSSTSRPVERTVWTRSGRSASPGAGWYDGSSSQRTDHGPDLVQRAPADPGNAVQCLSSFQGLGRHQMLAHTRLDRDGAEGVTDDVVQLACDPQPLLGRPSPGPLLGRLGARLGEVDPKATRSTER